MKRTISALLSALLLLGLSGCKDDSPPAPTNDTGEKLPSVRLCTSEIAYKADGSTGTYKKEYTYNEAGQILTMTMDQGTLQTTWDEELEVYLYEYLPYDGTVDTTEAYTYDSQGSLINYVLESAAQTKDYSDHSLRYTYSENGLPEKLSVEYTGESDPIRYDYLYRYDDQGRLIQVDQERDNYSAVMCDFAYDEEGRLITACYHYAEQIRQVQYVYSEDGLVEQMITSTAPSGTLKHSNNLVFKLRQTTEFTYDKSDRITSRKNYDSEGLLINSVICNYLPDGKRDSVCYFGLDGNLEDAFSYSYENGQTRCTWSHSGNTSEARELELLYDTDGLLIRTTEESGDYVEYTYETVYITEAQAAHLEKTHFLTKKIDLDGSPSKFGFDHRPLNDFYILLPYPEAPLLETDTLRS